MTGRACCCSGPCTHAYEDGISALTDRLFGRSEPATPERHLSGNHVPREGHNPCAQINHSDVAVFTRDLFGLGD